MKTRHASTAPTVGALAPERCHDGLESDEVAELLRDIEIAEQQTADGDVVSHQIFRQELLRRISE